MVVFIFFDIFFIINLMLGLLGEIMIFKDLLLRLRYFFICLVVFFVYVVFRVNILVFGNNDCSFLICLNYFLNVFLLFLFCFL